MTIKRRMRTRGQVVLLFAVLTPVLFGFLGLALDVLWAYSAKTLLVRALDASALSALRAVHGGTNAMDAALQRTLEANFPAGTLLTESLSHTRLIENLQGSQRITVTARATSPTFFLRWFGHDHFDISATATSFRRDVNLVLVLDYSGSLSGELPEVKAAAKNFVDTFDDVRDQVGLVSFSTAGRLDYVPQTSFKTDLRTIIDSLETNWSTNSSLGLWLAYEALLDLPDPDKAEKLNAIIFFTDGEANTFASEFNVSTTGSNRCDTTPKVGVLTSLGPRGLFDKDAPPPPVTSQTLAPGCVGSPSSVEDLVSSIPLFWEPQGPGGPQIYIDSSGPNTEFPLVGVSTSLGESNIRKVAQNMQLNAARLARTDPLAILVSSIGLGSVDALALKRVANDPSTGFYDPNQPTGVYAYAPTAADIEDAFSEVKSSVSRLVQ